MIFRQPYFGFKFKSKQIQVACKNSHPSSLLARVALRRMTVFAGQDTGSSKSLLYFLLSGSQTQSQRLKAMERLKQFKCRVLISTDLVRYLRS